MQVLAVIIRGNANSSINAHLQSCHVAHFCPAKKKINNNTHTVGAQSLCRCRRKLRKFKVLYLGSKKS